ncbi:cupin domain-containing protein [Paraburkholderia gardini]|uniref:Cupin domain-containing protein n=1 Tax=Paraburkholderia gardini TaxID=2823469 RepID=A0ABM8U7W2_9BURK|nr:cupin domain-containing protein [Paraburkholderia gardini]CAG4913714.1 hypothetical protein R54767_04029 [Paraburkholderia gardini]
MSNTKASSEMPRRIVTGVRGGKSVVVSDGLVPNAHLHAATPGLVSALAWATSSHPELPAGQTDSAHPGLVVTPAYGETRLLIVKFPPDSVMAAPGFDPAAAGEEFATHLPGLAELFERDHPGMHTTESIDYDIVVDGEIWLELDDGHLTYMRAGDIAIQCGTRHAWRNHSDRVTTMAFILIGARRA